MIIDQLTLDVLTEQAKASSRLRMNLDLRNNSEDLSQRMLYYCIIDYYNAMSGMYM